jgi:hypothetical protein
MGGAGRDELIGCSARTGIRPLARQRAASTSQRGDQRRQKPWEDGHGVPRGGITSAHCIAAAVVAFDDVIPPEASTAPQPNRSHPLFNLSWLRPQHHNDSVNQVQTNALALQRLATRSSYALAHYTRTSDFITTLVFRRMTLSAFMRPGPSSTSLFPSKLSSS